jgi:hypothetical protein
LKVKKLFSILLLVIVLFNITGFFVIFKIEQFHIRKAIKRQIKAGVSEDELHFFSFSQKEFNELDWTKKGKEFRLENTMYDVVRLEKFKDFIHLYCVNDKEESVLFANLYERIQYKMNQESNIPNSPLNNILKIFNLVYVSKEYSYQLAGYSVQSASTLNDFRVVFYTSPFIKSETPPPNSII